MLRTIEQKAKHNEAQKKRYEAFKERFYNHVECSMCNAVGIIEYHHVGEEKDRPLSQLYSYTIERIIKEWKKCIPLCPNCHKIVHGMKVKKNG